MAVSRNANFTTEEITIKGEHSLYRLIMKLVELGIIDNLGLKQDADDFACLTLLLTAHINKAPALLRFVSHYFEDAKAYAFMQFFSHLSDLGIALEIIDNKLGEADPVYFSDYFFQAIQSKIKLIGYALDLESKNLVLFSNKALGMRTLHHWAGQQNIIYSVETTEHFIAMLDALNASYVPTALSGSATFSSFPSDRFPNQLNEISLAYQSVTKLPEECSQPFTLRAEFALAFSAIYQAYTRLHRVNQEDLDILYRHVKENLTDELKDTLDTIAKKLEALLPAASLPFFILSVPARIEKLNDNFDKNHCARMLALLMQACAELVENETWKTALLKVLPPSARDNSQLAAVYEQIQVPLARLKKVMLAYQEHPQLHYACDGKSARNQ